jgi:hypothetical protein
MLGWRSARDFRFRDRLGLRRNRPGPSGACDDQRRRVRPGWRRSGLVHRRCCSGCCFESDEHGSGGRVPSTGTAYGWPRPVCAAGRGPSGLGQGWIRRIRPALAPKPKPRGGDVERPVWADRHAGRESQVRDHRLRGAMRGDPHDPAGPWCGLARGRARLQRVQLAVAEGQPELLGVVLAALHLHDGEPARLARPGGPGAQQRRLPAAGRSRDDRHQDCVTGAKVSGVDIKAGL